MYVTFVIIIILVCQENKPYCLLHLQMGIHSVSTKHLDNHNTQICKVLFNEKPIIIITYPVSIEQELYYIHIQTIYLFIISSINVIIWTVQIIVRQISHFPYLTHPHT